MTVFDAILKTLGGRHIAGGGGPSHFPQGAFQNGMYEFHDLDAPQHEEAEKSLQRMNNKFFWIVSRLEESTGDTFDYFSKYLEMDG
eukprot:4034453-Amphidinium_carterae.1